MITIRDDDVLLPSKQWPDPLSRFKEVHELILQYPFALHVPTLLTGELDKIPAAIEYIKQETDAGRMRPQFHGKWHVDYANMSVEQILNDYKEAQEWFQRNLSIRFTQHMSPWGGGFEGSKRGAHMRPTAASVGITLVDCSAIIEPEHILDDKEFNREKYEGKEIFIHFWAGIGKLERALDKLRG
jgi:hypothetical protein